MLSKVAERVYWAARYLERIESTARLVSSYDKLLFDLPRSVEISWYNLIIINSLEQEFASRYSVKDEHNVLKFLLADDTNSASIISSIDAMRENVRTTRDVVPEASWELANELRLYIEEHIQQGINRRRRHEFLDHVIKSCQQIFGMWHGSMCHDSAWHFLSLGRNLERADMTTRILDAGVSAFIETRDEGSEVTGRQIIPGHVLRSLNAEQAYRRAVRSRVSAGEVASFILENEFFPRSINYCHESIRNHARRLPGGREFVAQMQDLMSLLAEIKVQQLDGKKMQAHLNNLQLSHMNIHNTISQTWFPLW
ncbi:MAG: alpha-E domain-containing protein [Cellvibrionaceae bacterium]|nr:alpha-E domain-containing protein [Cellvibrionaceae bacterium]